MTMPDQKYRKNDRCKPDKEKLKPMYCICSLLALILGVIYGGIG